MQKLIDIPIESVVLIIGDQLGRDLFYPQPRTDAAIVVLDPREKREFECNPGQAILRNLFLTERRNPTVIKVIKDSKRGEGDHSLMSKPESHRYARRQSRYKNSSESSKSALRSVLNP